MKGGNIMSRKRFLNLTVALLQDICRMPCNNKNLDGKTLKWYRDWKLTKTIYNSYDEAWKGFKYIIDMVNEYFGYNKYTY